MIRKNKQAVLRTHGGLGNQLFQILYGRLYSETYGVKLREIHDEKYPHSFQRSTYIYKSEYPLEFQRFVSSCRIPKVLNHISKKKENNFSIFGTTYIDGYFQCAEQYRDYRKELIKEHLTRLSDELKINNKINNKTLIHLRLGDFFKNRDAAKLYLKDRIENLPENSDLMTNDELLINQPLILKRLTEKKIKIVETKGMSAEQVLMEMSKYSRIEANDSTLSVWCSIFTSCNVFIKNTSLREVRDFLKTIKNGN